MSPVAKNHVPLLLAALVLVAAAACAPDVDDAVSPFDGDETDDSVGSGPGGKADGATSYRSGCGAPIRTGAYALKGNVVTPTGVLVNGYVVVEDEMIREVRTRAQGLPADVASAVSTNGIIFPGLLDGHSHVEYNHVPLADLGRRYGNRDQWPNAALYKTLVKDPKNAVTAAGLKCEALKHGEARALVGGTTGIQGTPQTACVRPMVRNLENVNFCEDRVRQNVMGVSGFDRSISGAPSFADAIADDIAHDKLDAVVLHIGEGIDEHALGEWQIVKDLGLDVPQLVMIHAAAFTATELGETSSAGAKIVWSPLSNLLLYGATANIPAALDAGVLVSLGADWAPSGSANVLGELKVADRVNQKLWAGRITDEELVQMVTINPAVTFGMDAEVGSIEPGKYADLMVVKKLTGKSAYRALIEARPQDVLLVAISGDPLFGTTALMDKLGKSGDYEVIDACGSPRAIDVTVVASDVPEADQSLASIESQLLAVNPRLTPVIDCTNDEALKAYAGTAVE